MGMWLVIGEAVIKVDEGENENGIAVVVKNRKVNGKPNDHYLSYLALANFSRAMKLTDIFPVERHTAEAYEFPSLIHEHSGAAILTKEHLRRFIEAKKMPAAKDWPETLSFLIRMTRWALKNCRRPTLYNW